MRYGRVALTALVAIVVMAVYDFLAYGMLLSAEFRRYPAVYRLHGASPVTFATMYAGFFAELFFAVVMYSKGYEGKGPGAAEGARFGVMLGLVLSTMFASISYGMLNISGQLALYIWVGGIIEWALVGAVIGAVYRPARAASGLR
jgi:hypothetical protein